MAFPSTKESEAPPGFNLRDLFNRPLDTVGDGTGSPDIRGAFTPGAPGVFRIESPPGRITYIQTLDFGIEGSGSVRADRYGMVTELANGMLLRVRDAAGAPIPSIQDIQITRSGNYYGIGAFIQFIDVGGTGSTFNARWEPAQGFALPLEPGYSIEFLGRDDLTALASHTCVAAGYSLAKLE